jgi:hypothetical protein
VNREEEKETELDIAVALWERICECKAAVIADSDPARRSDGLGGELLDDVVILLGGSTTAGEIRNFATDSTAAAAPV